MADIERDGEAVMSIGKVICGIADAVTPTAQAMQAIIGSPSPGFRVDVALAAVGEDSAKQIAKLATDLDQIGADLVTTGRDLMDVEEHNAGLASEIPEGRR